MFRTSLKKIWPIVPILGAFLFTSILLIIFDTSPLEGASAVWAGAFGTIEKVYSVTAFWIPLTFAAIGLLVTFTAGLWNIGIEGQIILGSLAASWVALTFDFSHGVMIFLEISAAMIAGALWAAISAVLKTKGKVHEIFSGLALTNLAIILTNFLISGPWQPAEGGTFRGTAPFREAALFVRYENSRLSIFSLVLLFIAIAIVSVLLSNTHWGLRLKALGRNARSSFLLGVSSDNETVYAMMLCGAFAGLGGAIRVLSWFDSLRQSISGGIGYLALLVVMLASYRIVLVPFISYFFSAILNGSITLQLRTQLHSSIGGILTGVLVLFVLLFSDYSSIFGKKGNPSNE
jgi:general nucleoside transport system permease protein